MDLSLLEALEKEESLFKKFSFVGTDDVRVAGNLKAGYTVNVRRVGESFSGPVGVGACCSGEWPDLSCSIETEAGCDALGGHYLGDGTTCAGVDCNSGACCQFSGDCDDTQDFLCGDCAIGHSCWMGYGTTCAETRCEGPCCIACPDFNCGCTPNLTYAECQDLRPFDCSSAWLLNGGDCGTYGTEEDFCCTQFGSSSCPDSCFTWGACCCNGTLICEVTISADQCNADCDPVGGTFIPFGTFAEAQAFCDDGMCGAACCVESPPGTCLDTPVYPLGNTFCDGTSLGPGTDCSHDSCE